MKVPLLGDSVQEPSEEFFLDLPTLFNARLPEGETRARGTWTIINDDPSIRIEDVGTDCANRKDEGGEETPSLFVFRVTLSSVNFTSPVSVDFRTRSSTARAGSDFEARSGTLTFQPGDGLETVRVVGLGDSSDEGDERFFVDLRNSTNAFLADRGAAAVIANDDVLVFFEDPVVEIVEGRSGTRNLRLTLRGIGPGQRPPNVQPSLRFQTFPNTPNLEFTARAGDDYVRSSGILTFPQFSTAAVLSVPVIGDQMIEKDEKFQVGIFCPLHARLALQEVSALIKNDDSNVSGGIGIAELAPSTVAAEPEERIDYRLTWLHPTRWRDLDTLELRIRDRRQTVLWAVFDETDGRFRLLDPRTGQLSRSAAPGSPSRLEGASGTLHLAGSKVEGSGKEGSSVRTTFSVSLRPSTAGRRYDVEVLATDDLGGRQGFQRVGTLRAVGAGDGSGIGLVLGAVAIAGVTTLALAGWFWRRRRAAGTRP